jgi:hypothetical protein
MAAIVTKPACWPAPGRLAACVCSPTLRGGLPKWQDNPAALHLTHRPPAMRFAVRLLVLITTVLGLGVAFAWAWDRSDTRAQAAAEAPPQR